MSKRLLSALISIFFACAVFGSDNEKDSLTETQLNERLNYLQSLLQKNERQTGNWWNTWTALYSAATVGQAAVAVSTPSKPLRQDMIVGAGTTILGVASQLLTPVRTHFIQVLPDSIRKLSITEKSALLIKGEEQLGKQAKIASAGKGWQVHALSGAVNLASGLITWIGFKRSFGEGVLNFALNSLVTEVQIWTQPVRAKKDYVHYIQQVSLGSVEINTRIPEFYSQVSLNSFQLGIRF